MANPLRRAALHVIGTPPRRPAPQGFFGGATSSRLYADFNAGIYSADTEIRAAMRVVRARARMLVRDNPYASGFLSELTNNVIGPQGVLLEAHVTSSDGRTKQKATNKAIESAWLDWSLPRHAAADRRTSWVDIQQLAISTVAMDGECFIRKLPYFGNRHGFALQFLDADQVDEFYNRGASTGQNEIRMGVEIDEYGAPVAYYVWSRQLSDFGGPRERLRIPASEIIHLFVRYRVQQTRGISWFAPALLNLKMLDGYTEAELVAARTSAAKMGFIVTVDPNGYTDTPTDGAESDRITEANPGTFEELGPNQDIRLFDPKHPSVAFKDFTKAILRGVSRGLNMAYTTLTGDLEAVNYSSIRAGLLSERDQYRNLQRWAVEQFHDPVYDAWRPNALLTGALAVDSRLASDYSERRWRARGWKWVDPKSDLLAAKLAIDLGLDSRSRLAGEQGKDWEEVVGELAHELEVSETEGVDVSGNQQAGGNAGGNPAARTRHARKVRALFRRFSAGELTQRQFFARYERLLLANGERPLRSRPARRLRALPTGTGE